MYISLTSRCNMSCAHCCYNCTSIGKDMSIKTFRNITKHFGEEMLALGGGEPTLHPKFWQILCESIGSFEAVWLATNGKQKEIAITLARMATTGVISCALSIDSFHEPISQEVKDAFHKEKRKNDFREVDRDRREIRNVTGHEIKSGRCDWGEERCPCDELFITPDGTMKVCGCSDSPIIGNINGNFIELYNVDGYKPGCWKDNKIVLRKAGIIK